MLIVERAALHSLGAIFLIVFMPVELLIKAAALAAFTFHSREACQSVMRNWRFLSLRAQLLAALCVWQSTLIGALLG